MKKKQTKNHSRYRQGVYFLIAGLICLLTASFIQIIFIRGTDFKKQYQNRQYTQCLNNNSVAKCQKNFPLADHN
jgi:hypothetical protein